MCFQRKTGDILKTVRDTAEVTIITNRKWHTPCQIRQKLLTLNDLENRYALLWLNGARQGLGCY